MVCTICHLSLVKDSVYEFIGLHITLNEKKKKNVLKFEDFFINVFKSLHLFDGKKNSNIVKR